MSYIYQKIELYKRFGDQEGNWSSVPIVINRPFNKDIKIGDGSKKDTFKFNLMNNYNKWYSGGQIIEQGDKILIYQGKNKTTFTHDDLLMDGIVQTIDNDNTTSKILTISGKNRTEMFLEGLTFVTFGVTQKSPPEILSECLNFHNRNNSNFTITWHPDNPTLKSDDTAFPTYLVETYYQPMYTTFEKFSSSTYTQDGNYQFYINKDNQLIWRRMTNQTLYDLHENDCLTFKIKDSEQTVINSLIINCGFTPFNKPIRTYAFDSSSRAKHGAKWKYYSKPNTIANDLIKFELERGLVDFGNTKFPQTYPYTTSWGVVVTNDKTWNDTIRDEAVRKGKEEGKQFLQYNNQARLQISCSLPFGEIYEVGSNISCTFPSNAITLKSLRITDIQYTDYETNLTLIEDVEI